MNMLYSFCKNYPVGLKVKKLVSILLSALLLVSVAPTLNVFAEEESKEVTLTTVTEYSIVPEGLESVSV